MKRSSSFMVFALLVCAMVTASNAEIPQAISHQGKVTDTGGAPVPDGTYDMQFDIYDTDTGGTALWNSGTLSVEVTGGVFSVLLGDGSPISLDFDEDYWLEVEIESDVQSPRQPLGSVGYAYMASELVPGTRVSGLVNTSPYAVIEGENTASSGIGDGILGGSHSTQGAGVTGWAYATSGITYGVFCRSDSPDGRGCYGLASATAGINYGVYGHSASTDGSGVYGYASATTGSPYGVRGRASLQAAVAFTAWSLPLGIYVYGVYGHASATTSASTGVLGSSASTSGVGVRGSVHTSTGNTKGVYGYSASTDGIAVLGYAPALEGTTYGGSFQSGSTSGTGVCGHAIAPMGITYGVYGKTDSNSGYAGYFDGDVHVTGSLSKASGSFLIDHPLDPENKLLRHNFVESPENLLIYRGRVQLDGVGKATVEMPEYFKALAKEDEASIQLTPIGTNPFLVSGQWSSDYADFSIHGAAGREVFWEVLTERDDPPMRRLVRPVEEDKGPNNKYCDRGRLLDPIAYGYPESMGRDYERHEKDRLRIEEERARMEGERLRRQGERARTDRSG